MRQPDTQGISSSGFLSTVTTVLLYSSLQHIAESRVNSSLDEVPQGFILSDPETIQGWRLYQFSEQPI